MLEVLKQFCIKNIIWSIILPPPLPNVLLRLKRLFIPLLWKNMWMKNFRFWDNLMHVFPFMTLLSPASGADRPNIKDQIWNAQVDFQSRCIPLWGNIKETSIALEPFLPIRPCCCLAFHAVLGKPIKTNSQVYKWQSQK